MKKIVVSSLVCIVIDQTIKYFVSSLEYAKSISIIPNFFRITYLQNKGGAFSILNGKVSVLILITVLLLGLFIYYLIKSKSYDICYGILLGGMIGNLIDRIIHGYVIDYLDFNFFSYSYPVFNFADMCIVISIIILLIKEWRNSNGRCEN